MLDLDLQVLLFKGLSGLAVCSGGPPGSAEAGGDENQGKMNGMKPGNKPGEVFAFFNEISIIDQLCNTLIARILPDGVHPSHFAIILHLALLGDEKTPQNLTEAMQVTKATMSHSLKVQEQRGFIQITPCAFDARSKLVYLTKAGRDFYAEAINVSGRTFRHFLRDEHRQRMLRALPDLIAIRQLLEENRVPLGED
jgi:DNA-binding MarR family transcriptional regulator